MRILIFSLFFVVATYFGEGMAQSVDKGSKQTLSGHIIDAESKETIISATIYAPEIEQGTYSNAYGFFSISPNAPITKLLISCIGYETLVLRLDKDTPFPLNISLKPQSNTIQELVVVGKSKQQLHTPQLGAVSVPMQIIKNTPTLLGENDLMKTLQLLPGVQSGSDGSAGVHVRGGGIDENLVLLDGVSLYNVDHLFGFFSVFTPEAVKKVDLYKGNFPAHFGGRLSSVIDVRTNDGHLQKYKGTISVGLLSSKVQLEGPIIKNRTSFNISARRTYIDLLINPFLPEDTQAGYYFYDLNAKLQHRLGAKDRLFLSFYKGLDKLYSDNQETLTRYDYATKPYGEPPAQHRLNVDINSYLAWGNVLGALRWNHIFSPKLYSDLTASYTGYRFLFDTQSKESERDREISYAALRYKSGIEDFALNWKMHYYASPMMEFRFGSSYIYHTFRPETYGISARGSEARELLAPFAGKTNNQLYAHESSLYADVKLQPIRDLVLNMGLRSTLFSVEGKTYVDLQPRLSAVYNFSSKLSTSLGYSRMTQHIHLLSSAALTLPTDLWVPTTRSFKPMVSDQLNWGLSYNLANGWQLSLDAYYKGMSGVLEYKDGTSFIGSSKAWEEKIVAGVARSYGLEFMLMKQVGKTTGWLGYMLSKSERRFPNQEINRGAWFPYKYDRRHKINAVLTHKISPRIELSASWEFYSGGVISLAYERMDAMPPNLDFEEVHYGGSQRTAFGSVGYIAHRNNYRLPPTHRLNASFNFFRFHKGGSKSIWNISLFNLYNAKNPGFVVPRDLVSKDSSSRPNRITKFTILPFIPSLSYTYKF